MKLSEAIRKGCEGTGQTQGTFTDSSGNLCVMGAAVKGIGQDPEYGVLKEYELHNQVFATKRLNPATKKNFSLGHPETVWDICINLNDVQGWTREAIAEWLEGEGL